MGKDEQGHDEWAEEQSERGSDALQAEQVVESYAEMNVRLAEAREVRCLDCGQTWPHAGHVHKLPFCRCNPRPYGRWVRDEEAEAAVRALFARPAR